MRTEIVSYQLNDFSYRTPIVYIDANGEPMVTYADEPPIHISKITFLYEIKIDELGFIESAKGIDVANAYLMHLAVNKGNKCVSSQSRALIHYFSFLVDMRMTWNHMPSRPNKRPTYRFKNYLEDAYRDRNITSRLSVSTSKSYMRNIVNFYRFLIAKNVPFDYPPFEHEVITVSVRGSESSMQATRSVAVQTTDLRLRISKQDKNETPNRLRALSEQEWTELDHIIRKDRRIIRYVNGVKSINALAIEISLMLLIMRYSGLRRSEAITFSETLIFKPTQKDLDDGYIEIRIGGFCGVKTKNNKERSIEIPSKLMLKLFEYKLSKRHTERRLKFEQMHPEKHIPIFLNNRGEPFSEATLNARWSEIRSTLSEKLGRKFEHKSHNLRATYGVFRLKSLMKVGMSQEDALSYVQFRMGHEDLKTTLAYLKQTQTLKSGAQLAEQAYEHIFDISGVQF